MARSFIVLIFSLTNGMEQQKKLARRLTLKGNLLVVEKIKIGHKATVAHECLKDGRFPHQELLTLISFLFFFL